MPQLNKRYGGKKIGTEMKIRLLSVVNLLKAVIPLILAASLLMAFAFGVRSVMVNLPYFKVKDIKVTRAKGGSYAADMFRNQPALMKCKGVSVFKVDINAMATQLKKGHPEFKKLKVNRVMPATIGIELEVREPIFLVKFDRYYPVDGDGVALSPDTKLASALPVITGFALTQKPKIGERIESSMLKGVLYAYSILKKASVIKKYGIQRIEVSNLKNLVIYLGSGLEARIGEGKLSDELKKLDEILKDPKVDKKNLRYVDLRFKDVVLGMR